MSLVKIRQSQIVSTYGPGALVDLPDYAVLVAVGRTSALSPLFPECGHGRPVGRQIEVSPDLFVCGDARCGGLGQVGIAVGDGLEAAGIIAKRILRTGG